MGFFYVLNYCTYKSKEIEREWEYEMIKGRQSEGNEK